MRVTDSVVLVVEITCILFAGSAGDVCADVIAATGFNDAAGMGADPTPDSPYAAGGTILGRGSPEPGWTSTWSGWTGSSNFIAQADVVFEGDLALRIQNSSSGFNYSTMREYTDQTGVFLLELWINVAEDSGNVTISGGSIQYTLSAYDTSNITISGTDFNYGYGTIGDLSGTLTGTLASGETINAAFSRHATASFSLTEYVIPAPGAIVLGSIGVGLVAHLRRRRAL